MKLPDNIRPIDIKAIFYGYFNCCGCHDFTAVFNTVKNHLSWASLDISNRPKFDTLYNSDGVYLLMSSLFENIELTNHSVSAYCEWATDEGRQLLSAMNKTTPDEVDKSEGIAFDGNYYPTN